jgi:conjugal transfer pilus assembly protein TraI
MSLRKFLLQTKGVRARLLNHVTDVALSNKAMPVLQTDPNELITSCGREILVQMRYACGVGNERFKTQYLPLLYKLALFVQTAPLKNDAYCEFGGAFKFGLTSALLTLRMSNGVLFTTTGGAERMGRLTPQYKFCAFAASLATVPLIVSHYVAITVNGVPWHFYDTKRNLYSALANADCEFSWVNPQTLPHPSLAILTLNGFFEPESLEGIEPIVLQEMCMAINPALHQPAIESKLAEVVRMGHDKALMIDLQERQHRFAGEQGALIDPGLLNALSVKNSEQATVAVPSPVPFSQESLSVPVSVPASPSAPNSTVLHEAHTAPLEGKVSDFFREWVTSVLMDDKKREKLHFQDSSCLIVERLWHVSVRAGRALSIRRSSYRKGLEGADDHVQIFCHTVVQG